MTLTQLRTEVAAELEAAEITARIYLAETVTSPSVVVSPGQPYVVRQAPDLVFGHQRVRLDLLLLGAPESAKRKAELIDELIEQVLAVLDKNDRDVVAVGQPGVTPNISGAKFVAAVITIEEDTEA